MRQRHLPWQRLYVILPLALVLLISSCGPPRAHAFFTSLSNLLKGTARAPPAPQQLVECINHKQHEEQHQGTTWHAAMADVPATLTCAGGWWSKKPQRIPLTIVTQLSANRITQLWAQCKSWPGPLSAAVHVAITQHTISPMQQDQSASAALSARNAQLLRQTIKAMADFHASVERDPSACRLDLILVYELYLEQRATMLYPVNQLRNLARLQARTDLIGLMDVDMLVSSKLAKSLLQPRQAAMMRDTCSQRTVYVMPAFETYGPEAATQADRLVRQSKTFLVRSVGKQVIAPFDSKRFPIGHNTTDFNRWYATDEQYRIEYAYRYEPWIIASRTAIPWHDIRFRGYGQNKIVHVAHTNASGFDFVVHPTGFIIHRAHELTAARKQLVVDMSKDKELKRTSQQGVAYTTVYGHSRGLWEQAKEAMDRGHYEPVLDEATKHCRDTLSWW